MLSLWPNLTPYFTNKSIAPVWQRWYSALVLNVNAAPSQIGTVTLDAQAAAIVTEPIPLPLSLPEGLYRLTYYLRKTVVGSTSTLTVTLGWTDGGVACTQTFAALTTNTTSATQTNSVTVRSDAGAAFTYALAYGSTGTAMQYAFDLRVEQLP